MTDDFKEIAEKIDKMLDEDTLRSIRNYSDNRLQTVKNQKEMAQKANLESKYLDKYILITGRKNITMIGHSEPDPNNITIAHVLSIKFQGKGFFRCHAKVCKINFNNEFKSIAHLTANASASCELEMFDDEQFDFHESDRLEIISKEKALALIKESKESIVKLMENVDL